MNKKILLSILIIVFFITNAKADSPLTSTSFYTAYSNVDIVKVAAKTKGKLNIKLLEYITDTTKPIDVKIAIINRVGWNIEGKYNAKLLLKYIFKKRSYKTIQEFKNGRADDLICYAYIKGMDDYFNVKDAYNYSLLALNKEPNSYTINIISFLLKSQTQEGCQVYRTMNKLRTMNNLMLDFRQDATKIIFEYTDTYNKNCN